MLVEELTVVHPPVEALAKVPEPAAKVFTFKVTELELETNFMIARAKALLPPPPVKVISGVLVYPLPEAVLVMPLTFPLELVVANPDALLVPPNGLGVTLTVGIEVYPLYYSMLINFSEDKNIPQSEASSHRLQQLHQKNRPHHPANNPSGFRS